MPDRELDVVVHGATGFVGKLTAAYLAEHASPDTRIGLSGRSREKLERTRTELGPLAQSWPVIVADSHDAPALAALAARTKVVATTVGPYQRYGLPLVEACAAAGTHYADLTGETLFMRAAIDAHDAAARRSGARIVHACGFDSIPSDLGVQLLHDRVTRDGAGELERTSLVVMSLRGGLSGGTLASLTGQLDEAKQDRETAKLVADPYALSPDRAGEPDLGDERDLQGIERDPELGLWLAPFVMASINTRAVRRSNALQDWAYGRRFRYREVMSTGRSPIGPVLAGATVGGLGALMAGLSFGPTLKVLDLVLPSPGDGPGDEARRKGRFTIHIHTRTSTGRRYRATVAAPGDPGYAATAVMLGESALCLAHDEARLPDRAGVLTPATGLGPALTARLRTAGQTYEAEEL